MITFFYDRITEYFRFSWFSSIYSFLKRKVLRCISWLSNSSITKVIEYLTYMKLLVSLYFFLQNDRDEGLRHWLAFILLKQLTFYDLIIHRSNPEGTFPLKKEKKYGPPIFILYSKWEAETHLETHSLSGGESYNCYLKLACWERCFDERRKEK